MALMLNNILDTEDKIKTYYRNSEEIERLKCKLELLQKNLEAIQKDINESNITLISSVRGIAYDGVNIQSSNTSSEQERAIDRAFLNLEKQEENVKCKILEIKTIIRELEVNNSDMEFIINKLSSESKIILESMYKNKNSSIQLSFRLNLDQSTVIRKKQRIIEDITKWMREYC